MSAKLDRIIKDLKEAISGANKKTTSSLDTPATVTRIEGDIAWVHMDGGVAETPVKRTIDAKVGDTVQVRSKGGQAWITGNQTAPPTDDTVAKEADTKAKDANILAKLAQKTADKAGKTATNYLSWSAEYGLVVSEDATEDVTEMQGGNTRITSDGMEVYHGQTRVAHFGDEVILGDEDGANAYLDPDTFNITNEDGVQFFSVDMDGDPIQTYKWIGGDLVIVSPGEANISISDLAFSDVVPDGNEVLVDSALHVGNTVNRPQWTVTKGTPKTEQVTVPLGITLTLVYDGNHNYTVSFTAPNVTTRFRLGLKGYIYVDAPSFTFGTRQGENGAFSASIGEGLIAIDDNQTVFGKYNAEETDRAIVVGGGTSNNPKTIYTMDWSGKEWHYGDGVQDITSQINVTATAGGSSISSAYFAKSGNIGMLLITVDSTQAIGTGLNVIMAELPSECWPIQYCTGVGYYDGSSIVGRISDADGVVVVRNASSSAVTLTDGVNLAFTYIVA